MIAESATASSPGAKRVMLLAAGAQSAALRIQSLLPPHISEENDQKMDQLETSMSKEDFEVHKALAGLSAALGPNGGSDSKTADSAYARFNKIKKEILLLSRQNTNVRSLAISLNQKRNAALLCQNALAALEKAVREEPLRNREPEMPR
jgi:hypothetical protein